MFLIILISALISAGLTVGVISYAFDTKDMTGHNAGLKVLCILTLVSWCFTSAQMIFYDKWYSVHKETVTHCHDKNEKDIDCLSTDDKK